MQSSPRSNIPIILLAAGASRRMLGRDKLLEDIDGVSLLRRQVDRAIHVSNTVLVTLPPSPHSRYDVLVDKNVKIIPVSDAQLGVGHSLRAGIAALPDGTGKAMVLLPDLPDITTKDIQSIICAAHSAPDNLIWRGTTASGAPGHPILFDHSLFDALKTLTGDQGGAEIVKAHADQTVLVPLPGEHARLDLDTPEDWEAWRTNS